LLLELRYQSCNVMNSHHFYESVFEALPVPALLIKPDAPQFEILDVNENFFEIYSDPDAQIIGRPFFEVFPGNLHNANDLNAKIQLNSLKTVIESGKPHDLGVQKHEFKNRTTGKKEQAYYKIKNTPITDVDGNVECILHTVIDVTSEKIHKQKTEKNEKRFRSLIENGSDVLFVLNKDGQPTYISPNISNVLGYSVESAMNFKPDEIMHPQDLPRVMKEIGVALSNPAMPITVTPARMRHKNGSWRWMAGTITNMLHDPSINGIVDNFRDITEKVEADKKLRESNEKFQSLIQSIDGIFWEADSNTFNFNYVSPQVEEILGYSPEEWVNSEGFWQKNIHPEDRDSAVQYCHHETNEGRNHEFEYRFRKKDGSYVWLRDVVTVVVNKGKPNLLRGFLLDISRQKELQAQLDDAYNLTKIGHWELNLIEHTLSWSKYVKELHEVPQDYEPDLESAINFYEKGENQQKIEKAVAYAVEEGKTFDLELKIITAKKNEKWIRTVGKPIFSNHECVAVYGTTQDITSRKTAELADRSNRLKLQNILDQAIDVICIIDEDGRLEVVSSASEQVWGYKPEELIGTRYMDLIYEKDKELTQEVAASIMQGNDVTYFENRYVHKSGEIVPILWSATWSDADQRMYATARDARELKKAQKELKATEEQLRNIVEHSTNMFYTHGVDGVLTYVSPQSEHFLGYKPEETKRRWLDFITDHPDNQLGSERTDKAIQTGKVQPPYELQLKKSDGQLIWVEVNEAPLLKDGKTVAIVGSLTDITDRKHYQQQLKRSLERYDYVSKASRDAIYDWDIETDNLHWGEGFQKLFGYDITEDLFPLQDFTNMVHPSDHPEAQNSLDEALQSDKTFWSCEYRFRKKNGQYAYVIENGYIIRNDSGKAIRMVGAIRDITDSKKQQVQKELKQSVSQFFKSGLKLNEFMPDLLGKLAEEGNFEFAEFWLCTTDQSSLLLHSTYNRNGQGSKFHELSSDVKRFKFKEGLPGEIWESKKEMLWDKIDQHPNFVRSEAAGNAGLLSAYALPLLSNDKFVGVLLFGSKKPAVEIEQNIHRFEGLSESIGKEIQRKLQEEEFFLLFQSAPEIIGVAAPDGRFIRVNPAFCEITGYTEEELTSQPFTNFLHPDDMESTIHEFSDTITGKRHAHNFVNRYIKKSGDIVWISWYSSDVFGDDEFVFAFGRDVTDNKKLEELLNQTNKLAKVGSWELLMDGGEPGSMYWSETTREILQVEDDYSPTLPDSLEFYESDSKMLIQRAVESAIEKGTSFDLELNLSTANGENRWVRCIGDTEFKDGKCVRLFGSIQDISEKVVAELERVRILESISDAFYALNSNWEFTYYNSEAERLLNKEAYDVLGKNIWDTFEPARESDLYPIYKTIVEEKTSRTFEYYYEPIEAWLEVSAYYHEGGLSVFFRNITDRKEAQEKLKKLNSELQIQTEELAASNAELEQFAYVASHDLQEPLRMVSSFLTQLDKKYQDQLDERAHQYIHFAVDGAQRMRQIILDLLNYSRIGKNSEFKEVDLNKVIQNALKAEQATIKEKKAIIEYGEFPTVYGAESPLLQVFQNLLNNALKYQKPNTIPEIKLKTEEVTDSHWTFSVSDNGIGIETEFADSIFNIFQRLHTRDEYAGTGIGLAIAKKIIERHDGKVWVDSDGENGCTFYFTIGKNRTGI
jgi:PAS domain S-box-containing protein